MSKQSRASRAKPATGDLTPALYGAAVALGRTRDAAEVARVAIGETRRAAHVDAVALYVLDAERQAFVLKEFAGTSSGLRERMRLLPVHDLGLHAAVAITSIPVVEHPTPHLRAALAEEGFRFVTVAPVVGQDEPLGVLYLASRAPLSLSPEASALVQAIGGLVGVALENATLRERLVANQERLRALAGGILRAREDEARRIAHELHDEAGQLLAALHITLDTLVPQAPDQDAIVRTLHEALDRVESQLRRLARELRPTILDDLGLGPALEWLAQGVAERTPLERAAGGPRRRAWWTPAARAG